MPTINILDKIESPNILFAIVLDGIKSILFLPRIFIKFSFILSNGRKKFLSLVNSPVIISSELIIDFVFCLSKVFNTSSSLATNKSKPINKFVSPYESRIVFISFGSLKILKKLFTAPPFWAKPVISSTPEPFPSIWAAVAKIAPIVTTPVPPIPAIIIPYDCCISGNIGSEIFEFILSINELSMFFFNFTSPTIDTKLGQNPSTHE